MQISVDVFNSLFFFIFKVMVILAIVHWLVEQSRDLSAALARSCLAFAAIAVLTIPVLALCLPSLPVLVVPRALMHWSDVPLVAQSNGQLTYNGAMVAILSLYLIVASWLLCYMIIGVTQVVRIDRRARAAVHSAQQIAECIARDLGLAKTPMLKASNEITSPQVWGWRRPVVLLPQDYHQWPDGRLRRVLIHELAHVERGDWSVKLALHMVGALLWFIPAIWLTVRRSAWYAELACDDCVVRLEGNRAEYAGDLMAFAAKDANPEATIGALSLINKRAIYLRIHSVLDGTRVRTPASFIDSAKGYVLVLMLILPLASAQAIVRKMPDPLEQDIRQFRIAFLPAHHVPGQKDPQNEPPVTVPNPGFPNGEMKALLTSITLPPPTQEEVIIIGWQNNNDVAFKSNKVTLENITIIPKIVMEGPVPLVTSMPQYPQRALRRGIEGSVTVTFDVAITGELENIRIVRETSGSIFNHAVLDALGEFRFRPQTVNGQYIITKNISETFTFQLIDGITDNHSQANHSQTNQQRPEANTYAAKAE